MKIYVHDWTNINAPLFSFTYCFIQLINKLTHSEKDLEIVYLNSDNCNLNFEGIEFQLFDCELLIVDNNTYKLISYSDGWSSAMSFIKETNNKNNICLWGGLWVLSNEFFNDTRSQFKDLPYVSRHATVDLDCIYEFRKSKKTLLDKFTFHGNYGAMPRNVILSLNDEKYSKHFTPSTNLYPEEYFLNLIDHKVGLSITGVHDMCFRDVEYMAIGLPMLRFEYLIKKDPPLIPNFHYISIPRLDQSQEEERWCGANNIELQSYVRNEDTDIYADAYYTRFLEVKDDVEFLQFISNNAREYYETYMHPRNRVSNILKLLEMGITDD